MFGTGRLGSILSPKGLDKIGKNTEKEEQKLLQNNQIFTADARDNDEVIVSIGRHSGGLNAVAQLDMGSYAHYIQEFYDIAEVPEVEEAIDIITNEVVAVENDEDVMSVTVDNLEVPETIREKIQERFDHVLDITGINKSGFDIFRDWFISGRQGFYMLPHKNPKNGLEGVVMLDPRYLRSITKLEYERDYQNNTDVPLIKSKERGYVYDTTNQQKTGTATTITNTLGSTLWLPHESVAYVDSGLKKDDRGIVPSRLKKAIKTANNLTTVEDATVIYAITRAPERRAFYLDVGTLGTNAAKVYMEEMMSNYQTELNYDRTSGKVVNNQSTMGIVEDFWMPRREGANATEIETLDGGQQLGEMRHVFYFKEKLYTALKIPKGRVENNGGMVNIGGSDLAEVDREEHRFNKYTRRLGRSHADIVKQILLTDLLLTKTISRQELKEFSKYIKVNYNADSYVVEQQESETMANRVNNLQTLEPYVGQILSRRYALTKILRMTDEEIEAEAKQIEKERSQNLYGGVEGGAESPLKRPDAGGF